MAKISQPFEHHTLHLYSSLRENGAPTLDRIIEMNQTPKRDSLGLDMDDDEHARETLLPDANQRKFIVTPANDPLEKV